MGMRAQSRSLESLLFSIFCWLRSKSPQGRYHAYPRHFTRGAYLIFVPCWTVLAAYVDTYTTFHQTWFWVGVPVGAAIGARKLLTRNRKETHRESGADPPSR